MNKSSIRKVSEKEKDSSSNSNSICTSFSDHVLLRTLEGYVDAGYISDVAVLHPAGDASSVAEEPSISDPTKDEALVDEPSFCFATSACTAKAS